jgi:transglutaminase-like putative cysteine protease
MKWRFAFLSLILLLVLITGCLPSPTVTVTVPTHITTPTVITPTTRTTIVTPTTTLPTTTTVITPTTSIPPVTTIPVSGQRNYDTKHTITLTNDGSGTVTTLNIRVALVTALTPGQNEKTLSITPNNYTLSTDDMGNNIATFSFTNIGVGGQVTIEIDDSLTVSAVSYDLTAGTAGAETSFLSPEPYMESDNTQIQSLAAQITQDKTSPADKARAIYDWIGDHIKYAGYIPDIKGAVYALENTSGDCTEFACLMVALCRAAGIPARFLEGVTYTSVTNDPKHDWTEIYLPGPGWVPVDATWGRTKTARDKYFGRMTPDHILVMTGNPGLLAKYANTFNCMEYQWWGSHLSFTDTWKVINRSKPDSLLCTEAEFQQLVAVYASWGYEFSQSYDNYSQQAYDNKWTSFWIGDQNNESHRLNFDKSGNQWKPKTIPAY